MFTGLIEAVGSVDSILGGAEGMRIGILCPEIASGLAPGDSINVDGVCQTVVSSTQSAFSVEAVGDTLVKTTFRRLARGSRVNLERALRADGRLAVTWWDGARDRDGPDRFVARKRGQRGYGHRRMVPGHCINFFGFGIEHTYSSI